MAINCCVIQGRFTKDPELRTTKSDKSVVSFTIAVNGHRDGDVTFVDCTAWNGTAEFISKYFQKGQEIVVRGEIAQREWTTKDGENRKRTEINVQEASFCGSKADNGQAPAKHDFEDVASDGDDNLPF